MSPQLYAQLGHHRGRQDANQVTGGVEHRLIPALQPGHGVRNRAVQTVGKGQSGRGQLQLCFLLREGLLIQRVPEKSALDEIICLAQGEPVEKAGLHLHRVHHLGVPAAHHRELPHGPHQQGRQQQGQQGLRPGPADMAENVAPQETPGGPSRGSDGESQHRRGMSQVLHADFCRELPCLFQLPVVAVLQERQGAALAQSPEIDPGHEEGHQQEA